MTTTVTISCDHMGTYGGCIRRTWPERTPEAARAQAEAHGWYLTAARDLCPHHAGTKR